VKNTEPIVLTFSLALFAGGIGALYFSARLLFFGGDLTLDGSDRHILGGGFFVLAIGLFRLMGRAKEDRSVGSPSLWRFLGVTWFGTTVLSGWVMSGALLRANRFFSESAMVAGESAVIWKMLLIASTGYVAAASALSKQSDRRPNPDFERRSLLGIALAFGITGLCMLFPFVRDYSGSFILLSGSGVLTAVMMAWRSEKNSEVFASDEGAMNCYRVGKLFLSLSIGVFLLKLPGLGFSVSAQLPGVLSLFFLVSGGALISLGFGRGAFLD
jgi:hypothetical protein